MIKTYKIKHGLDLSVELSKGKQVAEYAVSHKGELLTSKHVSHFGVKSVISNQILRKYGNDKNVKLVKRIILPIPNQGIRWNAETKIIKVPCLKSVLNASYLPAFNKINQIEYGPEYAHVSIEIEELELRKSSSYIGVDLNTTGHCAVVADPNTGKTHKLGKKASYIHNKYREIRRDYGHRGKLTKLKEAKDRESRIVRDLNHKISTFIVRYAFERELGIKMEDLSGIRQRVWSAPEFKYNLHSWSYYQLRMFIEYKAKLLGVEVLYVNPAYTSKGCSICGAIGIRNGKIFKCPSCGHVDHADVNAAFNIALRPPQGVLVGQLHTERDVCNGSTDTPRRATV